MLERVTRLASGRSSKWVVIGIWIAAAVILAPFQPKLSELASDESESFLVRGSDSAEVDRILDEEFDNGNEVPTVIVFETTDATVDDYREKIADSVETLCKPDVLEGRVAVFWHEGPACGRLEGDLGPYVPPPAVNEERTIAITTVFTADDDTSTITRNVNAIREAVPASDAEGLRAYVTGRGGFDADRAEAVESIDETLMIFTILLILAILLLIYRSPSIAGVPLFVVALAYLVAAGVIYGLVEAGLTTISGQTTAILIVLMFGAGTDYCLLVLSRYRDALRRNEDHHDALAQAMVGASPAILSAGLTVVAVMATLALADFNATREMGPLLGLGVLVTMLAAFTLLPATLAALGRKAFWPKVIRFESENAEEEESHGIWRRVSGLVSRRPVWVALTVGLVLVAGCLGNIGGRDTLAFTDAFRDPPDSVKGQQLIRENFTPGRLAPVNLVMAADLSGDVVPQISEFDGVESSYWAAASRDPDTGDDQVNPQWIVADITLEDDPFAEETADRIPELKRKIEELQEKALEFRPDFDGDRRILLGGLTAENHDTAEGVARDVRVIVPLALLLILLILVVQLRAVVAPLYLVATVILSFGFALGVSSLFFTHVLGQPGSDPNLEIFAFVFLIGLGIDYNIFLVTRIREELRSGRAGDTREAVVLGLEKTGGVITSAGLILAGTFSAMMALTFESMFQFGFVICFGLLVDTFVVRTLLVPSIAYLLGEKNWWPGTSGRSAK